VIAKSGRGGFPFAKVSQVRKGLAPLSLISRSSIMKKFIHGILDAGLIVLGILSAGLGLKGFLLSSHFIDGGVTGVSMLLANVLGWQLAILIPV
jgi:uncharacterized membrane-anchored protein YitT (DUF2179 family)